MKPINKFFFTFLAIWLLSIGAKAQDIHLTQYNASPLNLNPALTGMFEGDFRFVGNQRTQWASVSTPYKTLSGSFDMRIIGSTSKAGMLCGGIVLNSDRAGASQFGLMQESASLSYTLGLGEASHHLIGIGVQGGLAQRSIRYDKLTFDEQYNGDAYDPGLSNGEAFSNTGYQYSDFSSGINWNFSPGNSVTSNAGVSAFHLFEPALQSFNGANSLRLSRKWNYYGNIRFPIFGNTDLIPSILYSHQHSNDEFVYGTNIRFGFEPHRGFNNAFIMGVHMRRKDAFAILSGVEYNNFNVGVSYDVNASPLKSASHYRGGLELSVIYIFKKVTSLKGPKKPCPVYL